MHIELRRQALVDNGMDPREADAAARRSFGNVTSLRERARDERGLPSVASFLQDLRFGVRLMARNWLHSAAIVITIAFGAGLNGALFLVFNAAFLRPPDVAQASEVVRLDDGQPDSGLPYPDYVDYRDRASAAIDLAAFGRIGVSVQIGRADARTAERVSSGLASGNFFDVLRVRPLYGRAFGGKDDLPPLGTPVVMLGEAYWTRRFNRDPSVVGQSIDINLQPFTIVGIVPGSFRGVEAAGSGKPFVPEMWVPLWSLPLLEPGDSKLVARTMWWGLQIIGRLRPGASLDQARAQVTTVAATLDREYPGQRRERAPWVGRVTDLDGRIFFGELGIVLAALGTATLLVLLIASANVAGLLLARASSRSREIAVRLSLGAGRLRIVRQFLTESLILSSTGIALGVLAAYWVLEVVAASASGQPLALSLVPDARVFAYAVALAGMVAAATGVVPALQASRTALLPALKDGAAPYRIGRLRGLFVGAEVAFCLMLLVVTGLLLRGVQRAQSIDPIIPVDNLISVETEDSALHGYKGERQAALLAEMQRRIEALPGVTGAALAHPIPFSGNRHATTLRRVDSADGPGLDVFLSAVSPPFFAVANLPLVRGRVFDATSREEVVVSQTLASQLWGTADPLGQRLTSGDFNRQSHIVVGVVRDAPFISLRERNEPFLFKAIDPAGGGSVFARTAGPATALTQAARTAAQGSDARLTFSVETVAEGVAGEITAAGARSMVAAAIGALALTLSLIGIGAVAAQAVVQRTHEIGVRIALGAGAVDAIALVVRGSIAPVLIGTAVGVVGAALLARVLSSQLYGLNAIDPAAFGGAALVLVAAALAATVIPARRAAHVDPLIALRAE